MLESNKVLICGKGSMGQQGNGENKDSQEFHEILLPKLDEKIKLIKSGSEFSYCLFGFLFL